MSTSTYDKRTTEALALLADDYKDITQAEAHAVSVKVGKVITSQDKVRGAEKRRMGALLLAVRESGICVAATDEDRNFADDQRKTAVSAWCKAYAPTITSALAFEYAEYDKRFSQAEAAEVLPSEAKANAFRSVGKDISGEKFVASLKATQEPDADGKTVKFTAKRFKTQAVADGIANASAATAPVIVTSDVMDIGTPSAKMHAATNAITAMIAEGYPLPMALQRKLESGFKASDKLRNDKTAKAV